MREGGAWLQAGSLHPSIHPPCQPGQPSQPERAAIQQPRLTFPEPSASLPATPAPHSGRTHLVVRQLEHYSIAERVAVHRKVPLAKLFSSTSPVTRIVPATCRLLESVLWSPHDGGWRWMACCIESECRIF